jgi:hypothetical protein
LGLLLLGEVFDAVAESSADLIERVVFVATAAQRVLLRATADLIDYLGAQPDHVKGVEHRDRVGTAVAYRVGMSAERVQRGVFNAVEEALGLGLQPRLVDAPGAAHDSVQRWAWRHPTWSRVRSTMMAARSTPIRDGRQMCSSTPGVFTTASRAGLVVRAFASTSIASQAACQSTPRCLANADTVVSS